MRRRCSGRALPRMAPVRERAGGRPAGSAAGGGRRKASGRCAACRQLPGVLGPGGPGRDGLRPRALDRLPPRPGCSPPHPPPPQFQSKGGGLTGGEGHVLGAKGLQDGRTRCNSCNQGRIGGGHGVMVGSAPARQRCGLRSPAPALSLMLACHGSAAQPTGRRMLLHACMPAHKPPRPSPPRLQAGGVGAAGRGAQRGSLVQQAACCRGRGSKARTQAGRLSWEQRCAGVTLD